jgi:hypothetical protein
MKLYRVVLVVLIVAGAAHADWEVHVNSNAVSSLFPVTGGLLWGSSGGTVRYEAGPGSLGKIVRSEDGLRSNDVTSVAVDASGQVWMGTAGYGVCVLQSDSTWRFINTQTLGLLSDDVLDISVCGSVVAVGTAGGVTVFDNGVFQRFFNGIDWGLSGCDSTIAVCCDTALLLVGTPCGLQQYDLASGFWSTVHPEARVLDIDYDGDSLFWAVSRDSIFTYDGSVLARVSKQFIRIDVMRAISALDTTVWVLTDGGPARYDAANRWWVRNNDGIPADLRDGTAVAIGEDGMEYVGTRRGAARLVEGTWEMIEAPGPCGNYIHDMAVDGKGRLWCTTGFRWSGAPHDANRGVYFYDGGTWDCLDRSVLPSLVTYPVDASPFDGSVWLGFWDAANGDLLQYDMADTGFTSYRGMLQSRVIADLHVSESGAVLFGEYTGSVSFGVLYNFNSSVVHYSVFDDPPCVHSPFMLALGDGEPGSYLIGSYNSEPEGSPPEIVMLDPGLSWSSKNDDECRTWSPLAGWPQGHVYALTTDPYGVMWCGTSAGLGSYDGTWHSVRTTIGVVWDIAVDANGTKWVAADDGLIELQGKGVLWNDFEGRRKIYDDTNSLLPDRPVKAVEPAADGSIWVGTAGGGVFNFMPDPPRKSGRFSGWVQAYPNPYDEYRADYNAPVRFEGYRAGSRVRIYDINGDLIAEIDADDAWDIANSEGEDVVSGVYMFHTYAEDGSEFVGRIVVIR